MITKLLIIAIAFGGCASKPSNIGYIKYKDAKCFCKINEDISMIINDNNTYKCSCGESNNIIDDDSCPTEITEIFYSKASGEITVCKGKILADNQKTRVIRITK